MRFENPNSKSIWGLFFGVPLDLGFWILDFHKIDYITKPRYNKSQMGFMNFITL
jgi:hypothetical protein